VRKVQQSLSFKTYDQISLEQGFIITVSYSHMKARQCPVTRNSTFYILNTTNNPDDRQCMWDFNQPRHKTATLPRRSEDSKQEKHIKHAE